MSPSRDFLHGMVSEVLAESEPLRISDMAPDQAAYYRRMGELRGLTSDAEIEAESNARPDTASEAELDEIARLAARR